MRIDILTLFPASVDAMMNVSILGRAQERGYITIRTHQIRDFTTNKQMQVDDYPYGGGRGAVMQADPLYRCWQHICDEAGERVHTIYMSPAGKTFTQADARRLKADYSRLILVCGHYEGIDQRFIDECVDEEISIGDYILTGGELASLVVADSVLRLQPGVLAEEKGYQEESYWDGLLEYPQYTRPEVWEGRAVPEVLLGGDHAKIDAWRGEQSRTRTRLRRPELYEQWCASHPIAEVPKWKRGENVRLVKTAEQFAAAAKLFAEGRQAVCADNWTPEYCRTLTEPQFLLQLQQEKAAGWVCYLHTTKDVPDGIVSINHKVGHIEHLFVTEEARGRGIGMKMLDFARRKLSEHEHPVLSVLNTNTRAIALYTRMGWKLTSGTELEFTPEQYPAVVKKCALVWMRYEGSTQK
jgi:tRNA (guanine37-N1)-methyltransferase